MPQKFFAKNKKKIFTAFFGVVFFAAIFWLIQPTPKVEAACGAECAVDSSVCKSDDTTWGTAYDTCTINISDFYNTASGISSCTSGSGKDQRWCLQDKCPKIVPPNPALNGKRCDIMTGNSNWLGACIDPKIKATGVWDADKNKCIECSGGKEVQIYGGASSLTAQTGDGNFDSACSGVSLQCDEKPVGCVGTGGFCNPGGVYTPCTSPVTCSGTGADAACAAPSVLTVTASSNTITQNATTNIEFTVTSGGSSVSGANVSISGAGTSGNCSTDSSGKCSIPTVKATSTGTATATASKATYTNGTTTIAVQPPGSLIVTASPSSITASTPTSVTFMVKGGGVPASGISVTLTGGYSGNCNTGGGGFCIISSINATSNITVTAHDSLGTFSDGTTTVTVTGATAPPPPPPAACSIDADCTDPKFAQCISGSCFECSNNTNCAHFSGLPTCDLSSSPRECVATVSPPPGPVCGNNTDGVCPTGCTNPPDTDCPVIPSTSAGPCASGRDNYRSPLSYCSIQELIQGATGWALGLVSSIVILFLVYGGIMYTMAAGDETKMESAKNIIYYAILGLAIILISYTLITEVKTILKVK